jgi:hypothetical protein
VATLITHIYNEEFLLPFFIAHHIDKFDEVFVIDYKSTDRSLEIIQDLAPKWHIIESRTLNMDPVELDKHVMSIEEKIVGPRIALTVTEFLLGDPSSVKGQVIIPSISLVNRENDEPFTIDLPFHEQRKFGIWIEPISRFESKLMRNDTIKSHTASFLDRGMTARSIHDFPITYTTGRHLEASFETSLLIYRVTNCFVNQEMFERRLQIQHKLDRSKPEDFLVSHTNFGLGLSIQDLLDVEKRERESAVDLSSLINKYLLLQGFSEHVRNSDRTTFEESLAAFDFMNQLQNSFTNYDSTTRSVLSNFNGDDLYILKNLPNFSHRGKKMLVALLHFLNEITKKVRLIKSNLKRFLS